MNHAVRALSIAIFAAIIGCAFPGAASVHVGEPESAVISRLGNPTHQYPDGKDHLLEYMTGPMGQQTYMVRISPDGKVVSLEQVLTVEKFALIKVGQATKDDVLRTIGAPSETAYLSLSQLEVWSYPYKESGAWNSMMHVHFDQAGIVRKMLNGPDPNRDPDRWRFGFGHRR